MDQLLPISATIDSCGLLLADGRQSIADLGAHHAHQDLLFLRATSSLDWERMLVLIFWGEEIGKK